MALGAASVLGLAGPLASAEPAAAEFRELADDFQGGAHALVKQFCVDCHSASHAERDLNLDRFESFAEVRKEPEIWVKVSEMLENGEMPPKDAEQLSPEQLKQLRGWVDRYLRAEAHANAGDPGPVVLRRLNNAQYVRTIRDLTGIPLDPTGTFPTDSAAGEGFTNTGGSLVMSPALLSKYLEAAKEISSHAVLVPDGFRFSAKTTRQDWTNEILADIREMYGRYTAAEGSTQVNLQGVIFDTNGGGRIPLERYLAATIEERAALSNGSKTSEMVAKERGLNAKYLTGLWGVLSNDKPSLLVGRLRERWLNAETSDIPALMGEITQWQTALTKLQNVGHMQDWVAAIDPLQAEQEISHAVPASATEETVIYLQTATAGDGSEQDVVVWKRPRLVRSGQPDILLRDVRSISQRRFDQRDRLFAGAENSLIAASEALEGKHAVDLVTLAEKHRVPADVLAAWITYLGVGADSALELKLMKERIDQAGGYEFVQGWHTDKIPQIMANSSGEHVRVPGNLKPHGVVVHPSPTMSVAVGWRSPISGKIAVDAVVTHAHPECGNGVSWSLELRRGGTRERLATGIAQGGTPVAMEPIKELTIQQGDLLSLIVGSRDGNHSCDLTDLELVISGEAGSWNLTRDVSGDLLSANPRADHLGNADVWHFYSEATSKGELALVVPRGSVLARWRDANAGDVRAALATEFGKLLLEGPTGEQDHPDTVLYRQLASLSGPLVSQHFATAVEISEETGAAADNAQWGLDPARFVAAEDAEGMETDSLRMAGGEVIAIRLPTDLVRGTTFVATASLAKQAEQASAQVRVTDAPAESPDAMWPNTPFLVNEGSAAHGRFEQAFHEFRQWFPPAVCYTKIVPVDEVVTLTLFHREDEPLRRLLLSEGEVQELERLWGELHFVSHDSLTLVDAFAQLMEYATQDSDPSAFEPFRTPIEQRAAAFRQELVDAEPVQLEALVRFASKVYRRPLTTREASELRGLYHQLRKEELGHEEAFRLTLARLFVAPAFLYLLEEAPSGTGSALVSNWELANRLSYFLTSSMPHEELSDLAERQRLSDPDVLAGQARRLFQGGGARPLATEFGCQWLQIYQFDQLDEKSERHFPEFAALRGDMYEEAIQYLTDFLQRDGSLLELIDGEHVIVNQALAEHYGIPNIQGEQWRRVADGRRYGRGGVLGLAAVLAKQSGASRTSPILRGTWISDVLLGEKLPNPPAGTPPIPEGAATETLTMREITLQHTRDPACASCHDRIDPLGFSLEAFDAIGRMQKLDVDGKPINSHAEFRDGTKLEGIDGLREYISDQRRDAFVEQFCRKLLGYALGRKTRLSDEPLLESMQAALKKHDYRVSVAIEQIVRSRQFREIRGRDVEIVEKN